ncbi:MAG TPA: hypothetical protein PKA85_06415 [Ferruginibacter sp.]|nr:hypothetical protein [Ferruginibacter sp.]
MEELKPRLTPSELRKKEALEKEQSLLKKCEEYAEQLLGGKEQVVKLSNLHKGLFYLPIEDEDGNIEKMGILKPIDRHILSHATTKLDDDGLYVFLEACMRECWLAGDTCILDDDDYFLPAAGKFNKMLEGKKATFLKRSAMR